MRQFIATHLKSWGYRVTQAADATAAMDALTGDGSEISIVITDWMMPGATGVELCRRIRAAGIGRYVYVILLTAKKTEADLLEGFDAGVDDYLAKPVRPDELRARLKAASRIVGLERELEARNHSLRGAMVRLEDAYGRMHRDLAAAAASLERLLPRPGRFGGIAFQWLFEPSAVLGGDGLGVVLDPHSDLLVFYQVDVAGHGVPAALTSFMLQSLLNGAAARETQTEEEAPAPWSRRPADVASELNRRFRGGADTDYFTMVYGVLNRRTGEGLFTQAGHPSPLVWRHGSGTVEFIGDGGFPVGLLDDVAFEAQPFRLSVGDRLILHSDGLSECADPQGRPFGEERLSRLLREQAGGDLSSLVETVGNALRRWRTADRFEDDVSLLVIERLDVEPQ